YATNAPRSKQPCPDHRGWNEPPCAPHSPISYAFPTADGPRFGWNRQVVASTRSGGRVATDIHRMVEGRRRNAVNNCASTYHHRPVGEVMTAPAITVEKQMTAHDALALMTRRRVRHLPVVEGEAMIGFISIGDIVKSRIDEVEAEAEQMRVYIQTA